MGEFDLSRPTDDGEEQRFYMTYARSRPATLVPWIEEHNVPLLTNAMHRWSDATDRFLDMWEYDTPHVIDAGGYNVQAKFVDQYGNVTADEGAVKGELETPRPFYPYSLTEYHDWLCDHADEIEWATAMDYACEERFDKLWSVDDRVQATLENTLEQYELLEDAGHPYELFPVLQGRSVEKYVECYDWLDDHGLPTEYVGLGTVCRLSSEKRIVEVERAVREQTGVERLHGFGVKVAAYKHGASFETADSQAWVWGASNGLVYRLEQSVNGDYRMYSTKHSDSFTRTVESFKTYYAYVTWLKHGTPAIAAHEIDLQPEMTFDLTPTELLADGGK